MTDPENQTSESNASETPKPADAGFKIGSGDSEIRIQETKEAVCRLLKYAVSDSEKMIDESVLIRAIPVIQKNPAEFNAHDEKELWIVYSQLADFVNPATNESLWLKEQIDRCDRDEVGGNLQLNAKNMTAQAYRRTYDRFKKVLIGFSILFFILQGYTYFLSDAISDISAYHEDFIKISEEIASIKNAQATYSAGGKEDNCTSALRVLHIKRSIAINELDNTYQALRKLSWLGGGFLFANETLDFYKKNYITPCSDASLQTEQTASPTSAHQDPAPPGFEMSADKMAKSYAERNAFIEGAKSVLRICHYLLLPLVMGTLGSLAFVIRGILDSFSKSSLTLGANRRWDMRVYLGALLGLISGVVVDPTVEAAKPIDFSMLVWAFLMGYSVEFAFSLFDSLIEKGRRALGTLHEHQPHHKDENAK